MSVSIKIGPRIKELRDKAGMSQDALAQKMNLSRPAITQIENGSRKVSAEELVNFSQLLHVSVDDFLNPGREPEVHLQEEKAEKSSRPQLRISVPQKNLKKFKEVLLYILNKVGAKENIGEAVVYKLLYFIDFDFYEKYEEQLVGATYIKNKYGPTPVEFVKIVEKMVKDGEIEKVKSEYFKLQQTKYLPRRKPNLANLTAAEIEVIDDVLNRLSEMNASQISAYSHSDVPWMSTKDGETIDYESVFYRTPPYSVRAYAEENG
ncbi:MAG: type II toxin-antitoxin system antitoxin SocA domain-containing protein [Nitrospirota bacterium]